MEYLSASASNVMRCWWNVFIFLLMVFFSSAAKRFLWQKENRAIYPTLTNSTKTLFILHSRLYVLPLICNVNITGVTSIAVDKRLVRDSSIAEITSSFQRLRDSANEFYNKPLNLSVVSVFVLWSLHEFPSGVAPLWKNFMTPDRNANAVIASMSRWRYRKGGHFKRSQRNCSVMIYPFPE